MYFELYKRYKQKYEDLQMINRKYIIFKKIINNIYNS